MSDVSSLTRVSAESYTAHSELARAALPQQTLPARLMLSGCPVLQDSEICLFSFESERSHVSECEGL